MSQQLPSSRIYPTPVSGDEFTSEINLKQDKLTAGKGIQIEGNIISSTVNSAEWGNISGDIASQEDLINKIEECGQVDNVTLEKTEENKIKSVAITDRNAFSENPVKFWSGTKAEYERQKIEELHPDYLCFITDEDVDTIEKTLLPVGFIGQAIWIDESANFQRILNGQKISTYTFKHFKEWLIKVGQIIPGILVTEEAWQAEKTMSVFGQCGKFVINEEEGTIRLPLVINSQGLLGLEGLGEIKAESLPNITGTLYNSGTTYQDVGLDGGVTSGAIKIETDSASRYSNSNTPDYRNSNLGWSFNASRSSSAYQDGAPVQQEAILYPYFIQVATGLEETLPAITDYKANIPFSFGQSQWFPFNPYNVSWLRSDGTFHSGEMYTSYYQWLINNIGKVITDMEGKIVKIDSEYSDYDWVVDTANKKFRLPLLNGEENLSSNKYEEFSLGESGSEYISKANGFISFWQVASSSGQYFQLLNKNTEKVDFQCSSGNFGLPVSIFVRKGDTVQYTYTTPNNAVRPPRFTYAKGDGSLYFYVGDTLKDVGVIDTFGIVNEVIGVVDEVSRVSSRVTELTGEVSAISNEVSKVSDEFSTVTEEVSELSGKVSNMELNKADLSLSNLDSTGEAKLKSMIRVVDDVPDVFEEGVLYCIPE